MELDDAIRRLATPSFVSFQSSKHLVGQVKKSAAKLDRERRKKKLPTHVRKPVLIPVDERHHQRGMEVTPWELLHTLGRATVLAGQGSSRALAQHWACLKYITALQDNLRGRMELSDDGKDPRYHRKSVQAEDLGISFALAAALRIVQARHPAYRFEIVDADVALEAGWPLRGREVRLRENVRLRPDYFLVGTREGAASRIVTVECKGSHGKVEDQHVQLAKAAAQVNAVVLGGKPGQAKPPPSLMMATSLASRGGIEVRILDPEGDGELELPHQRSPALNGPVEQYNMPAIVPVRDIDGSQDTRPGFYIPPERTEWFSRVLSRTAAAGLLAFAGDRGAARRLLTERQHQRVGAEYAHTGPGVRCDTEITLADMAFVGTDHVFRFGPQRVEAFSGILVGLHTLLSQEQDIAGYESVLPQVMDVWRQHRQEAEDEWGGAIAMDSDGAVLGLRPMGAGRQQLR